MPLVTLTLQAPEDLQLHRLGNALGRLGCRVLSTPVRANPERHGNSHVVPMARHKRQAVIPWPPQGPEAASMRETADAIRECSA